MDNRPEPFKQADATWATIFASVESYYEHDRLNNNLSDARPNTAQASTAGTKQSVAGRKRKFEAVKSPPAVCEQCKKDWAVKSERFCRRCRRDHLDRLDESGYLQRAVIESHAHRGRDQQQAREDEPSPWVENSIREKEK